MTTEITALVEQLSDQPLDPKDPSYSVDDVAAVVEQIFHALGSEDIAAVIEHAVKAGSLSPAEGALVLGVGQWSGNEGGRSQIATLHRWLREGDDAVRIALAIEQDWFPFATTDEMEGALSVIESRFPQFKSRCREIVRARAGRD